MNVPGPDVPRLPSADLFAAADPTGQDRERARLRARRDAGVWYAVVGAAMLFVGSLSTAIAIGGVAMIVFGASQYGWWSLRLARTQEDPWQDPELDAWEEEHYGR